MSKRNHSSIIQEYKFLHNKILKMSHEGLSGPLKMKRKVKKVRQFLRRMFEIEETCKQMGWGHPESYFNKQAKTVSLRELEEAKMASKTLTMPDGTLPNSKIEPLPMADNSPIRGKMPSDSGIKILDERVDMSDDRVAKALKTVSVNSDGSLFETPKMEGSFLDRRNQE
jgi:hypothetical protein